MSKHTLHNGQELIMYNLYYNGELMNSHTFQHKDNIAGYVFDLNNDSEGEITYGEA